MIDRVLRVAALPRAGETVASRSAAVHAGGKGANQAAALALLGARTRMMGRTGREGRFIVEALGDAGVDVRAVVTTDPVAGSATVLVADGGENSIVLANESNRRIELRRIEAFLAKARQGEIVLLQNECAHLHETIHHASARALRVWLNAAPADEGLRGLRCEKLAGLIVNETEAEALTGDSDPDAALESLAARMPGGTAVITLGARGAIVAVGRARYRHAGFEVEAVDTVGCGDAFVGAFVAALAEGLDAAVALARGNAAGALAAMRVGAMRSLPSRAEVDAVAMLPERTRLQPRPPADDEPRAPRACERCGHDLRGQPVGGRCPECGAEIPNAAFAGRWTSAGVRRRFLVGIRWTFLSAIAATLWLCVPIAVEVVRPFPTWGRPMILVAFFGLFAAHVGLMAVGTHSLAKGAASRRRGMLLHGANALRLLLIVALTSETIDPSGIGGLAATLWTGLVLAVLALDGATPILVRAALWDGDARIRRPWLFWIPTGLSALAFALVLRSTGRSVDTWVSLIAGTWALSHLAHGVLLLQVARRIRRRE